MTALSALALWVALAAGALGPAAEAPVELAQGWQYRFTELDADVLHDPWDAPGWEPLTLPRRPPATGAMLWMRVQLPQGHWTQPALSVDAINGNFELYVEDARVLQWPEAGGLWADGPQGAPWLLLDLPQDAPGHRLTLRTRVVYQPSGIRGVPVLGNRADHLERAFRRDLAPLVVGLLILLSGALTALLLVRRHRWKLPLVSALASMTLGAYVVFHTDLKDVLWPAPRFWFCVWLVSVPVQVVCQLSFVDQLFGSGPRGVLARVVKANVVLALVVAACTLVALSFTWVHNWEAQRWAGRLLAVPNQVLRLSILPSVLVALAVMLQRAREGNRDALLYCLALMVQLLATTSAVVAALGWEAWVWVPRTHVGALALTVALVVILQRHHEQLSRNVLSFSTQLRERAEERERLVRDLHDGVGGLATNIRMLAELGMRSSDRAARALQSIFELSGRTVAELRGFVQALDGDGMDWGALAAELRRMGAQLVEAQERTLRMESRVAPDSAPPTAPVTLHVLRIFREAVTNALKHSAGGDVVVDLTVTPAALLLRVENTAAPRATAEGLNTGRGVANMAVRARDLGGTATLEEAHGRVVMLLQVPLPRNPPAPGPRPT